MARWDRYDPASAEGIMPVAAWVRITSGEYCRSRLEPGYLLRAQALRLELLEGLRREGKRGAFWGLEDAW
ncbi:MAG: hypothetical protein ACREMG_00140 [Gemmatimonadales bacterium]